MIGGEGDVVEHLDPIFAHHSLPGSTPRPGLRGAPANPIPPNEGSCTVAPMVPDTS